MPTALLSVYDKGLIGDFASGLVRMGWDIQASGGTAKALLERGIAVTDTGDLVGRPILGHRVVTLSRVIHAGLLARDTEEDNAELAFHGISRIDLACVNLYPLQAEIAEQGSTPESVREMTDIGGPTMLRSAAKGRRLVISDRSLYFPLLEWMARGCPQEAAVRDLMALVVDYEVAEYCLASANYWAGPNYQGKIVDFPDPRHALRAMLVGM